METPALREFYQQHAKSLGEFEILAINIDEFRGAAEDAALIVYPMVRYAIYSAIAMFLVTAMHPIVAFGITVVISVVTGMVDPSGPSFLPVWLREALYAVLPSTGLLSEDKFLAITQSSLQKTPWTEHLTALAYGLDYSLVFVLLAVWLFRHRSLARE